MAAPGTEQVTHPEVGEPEPFADVAEKSLANEAFTTFLRRSSSRRRMHPKLEDLHTVVSPESLTSIRPRPFKPARSRVQILASVYALSAVMLAATFLLMLRLRQQPRQVELMRGRRLVREVRAAFAESSEVPAVQVMAQGAESLVQFYEDLKSGAPDKLTQVAVETYLNVALNARKIVIIEQKLTGIQREMTQLLAKANPALLTSLQLGTTPESEASSEQASQEAEGMDDPRDSLQYAQWKEHASKLLHELKGLYAQNAELYTCMATELSSEGFSSLEMYLQLQYALSVSAVDAMTCAQGLLRKTGYLPPFKGTEELARDVAKAAAERTKWSWATRLLKKSEPEGAVSVSNEVVFLAKTVDKLTMLQTRSAQVRKEEPLPGVLKSWWLVNLPTTLSQGTM
ncbi:putative transmembrane protein [Toxoplasma gondii p89]|uniref:Putative transmembrane protein n=1 Tax=Toxoplasma gondii p89 TaxID=943119 RepID=A0A086J7A4_TOXGO|nr:putative transmembrane protein [Toxoplasma gondii p89]